MSDLEPDEAGSGEFLAQIGPFPVPIPTIDVFPDAVISAIQGPMGELGMHDVNLRTNGKYLYVSFRR